jgi:hypothetical protein
MRHDHLLAAFLENESGISVKGKRLLNKQDKRSSLLHSLLQSTKIWSDRVHLQTRPYVF